MQQLLFDTPDEELVVDIPEVTNLTPAERVWQGLLTQRLQDLTIRSGVAYCGVYPNIKAPEKPPVIRSDTGQIAYTGVGQDIPETVTAHVRSCVALTRLLSCEFPALFQPDILATRDRMIAIFEYHDGDEPFSGDTPDDGSRDEKAKNQRELQSFLLNIAHLSGEDFKSRLIKDFVHFQYCTPSSKLYQNWTAHNRDIAQLTRLIDKVDAILSTLLAEKTGHTGHLSHKARFHNGITNDDKYYIKLCGTDCIADTWAAHFVHDFHNYHGFRIVLSVLHAAVLDVRGVWYPWWDNACKAFGIYPTFPN